MTEAKKLKLAIETLRLIDDWWDGEQNTSPLHPGALIGPDDRTIKQLVSDALRRVKEPTK